MRWLLVLSSGVSWLDCEARLTTCFQLKLSYTVSFLDGAAMIWTYTLWVGLTWWEVCLTLSPESVFHAPVLYNIMVLWCRSKFTFVPFIIITIINQSNSILEIWWITMLYSLSKLLCHMFTRCRYIDNRMSSCCITTCHAPLQQCEQNWHVQQNSTWHLQVLFILRKFKCFQLTKSEFFYLLI
jgi:hypothetical protein